MATLTNSWQQLKQVLIGNTGYGNVYIRVYGKCDNYDIANNRTKVYAKSTIVTEGGYWWSDSGTTKTLSCTGLSTSSGAANGRYNVGETTLYEINGYVTHNDDGKKSVTISGNFKSDPWGWNATASATVDLPTIPRKATITDAPNFNDEESPTITYSNPAGNSVSSLQACISLTGDADDISYRDISKTGTTYTFELTDEERTTLRQATISNSRTVKFYVRTVIGNNTYYSNLERTFTIINGNPIFNDFEWETTNYNDLTGDNHTVIKGYSNVEITISDSNKAIAQKESTIASYQTTIGSKSNSSSQIEYPLKYIVEKVDGAVITTFAIDSRENSTSKVKPITNYINYNELAYQNLEVKRTQDVNPEVNLKWQGTIDLVDFGQEVNAINNVKYFYRNTSNEDFVEGTTQLTPVLTQIDGTVYRFEIDQNISGDLIDGFDVANSYIIKIVLEDKIMVVEDTDTLGSGSPAIAIKGNCVSLGAPYNENLGGRVQINGSLPSSGGDTLPLGGIIDYIGTEVPEGYELVSQNTYSSDEYFTGKTFMDGKPIYRKCFMSTNIPQGDINIGTINNTDWVVSISGTGLHATVDVWFPISSETSSNDYLYGEVRNNNVRVRSDVCGFRKVFMAVEYTKTTD